MQRETIVALATHPGIGAIAVVRLSGLQTLKIADSVFRGSVKPSETDRKFLRGKIINSMGEKIDDVLLTVFHAPKSYTGEDVVEISCHGGDYLANQIIFTILSTGARLARSGEFTERAFCNGKMDLTQAEAVMELIHAQTARYAHLAMEQLEGSFGKKISELRQEILECLAYFEAWIDFPEDNIEEIDRKNFRSYLLQIIEKLECLLKGTAIKRIFKDGFKVVLCGDANTGKSSLLNYLLGFDRAIVSPIRGTTRDILEEKITVEGYPLVIIDTAGISETDNLIDQEAIKRTYHVAQSADMCLHLVDITVPTHTTIFPNEILVFNKIDLLYNGFDHIQSHYPNALFISCMNGEGIQSLISLLLEKITQHKEHEPLFLINARHETLIEKSYESIKRALLSFDSGSAFEISAKELHESLNFIGEIIGLVPTEELLDTIFSNFCIGK